MSGQAATTPPAPGPDAPTAEHAREPGRPRRPRHGPLAVLFGPVVQKEARVRGRKWTTYVNRSAFLLVLLFFLWMGASSSMRGAWMSGGSRVADLQALQSVAPAAAMFAAVCLALVLPMIASSVAGGSICDERRGRTIEALLTTPLRSWHIVGGKVVSAFADLLVMTLLLVPVLLCVRLLGGLPALPIVACFSLILATCLVVISMAVMLSTYMKRASSTASTAYLGTVALFAAVFFAMMFTEQIYLWNRGGGSVWSMGPGSSGLFSTGTYLLFQPIVLAFYTMILGLGLESGGRGVRFTDVGLSLGFCLLLSAGFVAISAVGLRRAGQRAAPPPRRGRRKRARQEVSHAPDQSAKSRRRAAAARGSISVWSRPVLWREVALPVLAMPRRRALLIGVVVAAAVIPLVIWREHMTSTDAQTVIGLLGLTIALLVAATSTTAGFATERESRTFETLMTTRLTERELAWSKLAGALRRTLLVPALLLGFFGVLAALGHTHPFVLLQFTVILAGPIAMLAGLGVLLALVVRTATRASMINVLAAMGLWLAAPLVLSMIHAISGWSNATDALLSWFVTLSNPWMHAFAVLDAAHAARPITHASFDYPIGPRIGALGAFGLACAGSLFYASVGIACVEMARAVLRRMRMAR